MTEKLLKLETNKTMLVSNRYACSTTTGKTMDEGIKNEQGQVLLKWTLPRPPKIVKIDGTDRVYTFSYNFNVCAAWVNPEDVDRMLKIKEKICNCNNGTFKSAFAYCNLLDHNLWVYGNREGKVFTKESV